MVGVGTIQWVLYGDKGKRHTIHTRGYYVLTAKVRLFSVQSYLGLNKGSFMMEGDLTIFSFNNSDMLTPKTYNVGGQKSCLPLSYIAKAVDYRKKREHGYNVLSTSNSNLSAY